MVTANFSPPFPIQNALKRIKKTGDLYKPVLGKPVDLKKVLKNIPQFS